MAKDKKYTNIYGEPTTLSMLCMEEPTWAVSQIRKLDKLVESLKCCGNCTHWYINRLCTVLGGEDLDVEDGAGGV